MTAAETVRKLRAVTGAGLMDCAEALKHHPDPADAVEHLRTLGLAIIVRRPLPACGSHTCEVDLRQARGGERG